MSTPASTSIPSELAGWWRITETEAWSGKYLDMLGPALISFTGYDDRLRMDGTEEPHRSPTQLPRQVAPMIDGDATSLARANAQQQKVISRFLATGRSDPKDIFNWPSDSYMGMEASAHDALLGALVQEVKRRAGNATLPPIPEPNEVIRMTRQRVEPMVRGLFLLAEQDAVLQLLEGTVVFLTPSNIEHVLLNEGFSHSAWDIANVYLGSVNAESLGGRSAGILGLSQETTCFVTAKYLEGRGKFDDFLVHEAAHVFHNHRREFVGLPHTRTKEWLLPTEFAKRETFAFSCEVYARIVELSRSAKERVILFEEYAEDPFNVDVMDVEEHVDILREAVAAKNGWKRILKRCGSATPKKTRCSVLPGHKMAQVD